MVSGKQAGLNAIHGLPVHRMADRPAIEQRQFHPEKLPLSPAFPHTCLPEQVMSSLTGKTRIFSWWNWNNRLSLFSSAKKI